MYHVYRQVSHFIERMGPQEWILVLAVIIFIGCLTLRGFGSRSKY
jgi:hypothetical protein